MPLLAVLAASPGFAADTGPEYLEADAVSDPISDGFLLLRLPFEEERANTLHLRTFYQDRSYSGDPDRQEGGAGVAQAQLGQTGRLGDHGGRPGGVQEVRLA